MVKPWTPTELDEFKAALDSTPGDSLMARCKALAGWHDRTAQALRFKASSVGYSIPINAPNPDNIPAEVYQAEIATLRRRQAELEEWHRAFEETAVRCAELLPPLKIKQPALKDSPPSEYVYKILLGDWQAGELYRKGDTGGIGEFNADVLKRRVETLTHKIHLLHKYHKGVWPARRLVVDVLGDMCGGVGIYPGQEQYATQTANEQVLFVAELLTQFIASVSPLYEAVDVFMVIGNHGRVSKAHHRLDNWDYFAYQFVYERFKPYFGGAPKEGVNIYPSLATRCLYELAEIPGMTHCIGHGDDAKGWMGIPYYGIDRNVRLLSDLYDRPIHLQEYGHHHRRGSVEMPNAKRWIVNGTLAGASSYSVERLATASLPSQMLLVLHRDHGVISEETIYVEDRIKLEADDRGILTPTYGRE